MRLVRLTTVAILLAGVAPTLTNAHFKLLEPASWLVEDNRGDPQKLGPCGGTSAAAGTPSNVVGAAVGGSKLHIKLMETIYHPGFYRVALAVKSREELPPDPVAITRETPKGPWSISGAIQSAPQMPVLADGLFIHKSKPADPYETDVLLPNINCEKCTVQIVQFMEEHGYNKDGGYTYHHCAGFGALPNTSTMVAVTVPVFVKVCMMPPFRSRASPALTSTGGWPSMVSTS